MYLSFGDNCDTIEITPKFSTTSPFGYYNIEVTPIPCSSPDLGNWRIYFETFCKIHLFTVHYIKVPTYCLQNYNTSTGVVTSFDYPKQQQNSQQYTICVHSQKVEDWKEISVSIFTYLGIILLKVVKGSRVLRLFRFYSNIFENSCETIRIFSGNQEYVDYNQSASLI